MPGIHRAYPHGLLRMTGGATLCLLLGACNLITGASDLTVDESDPGQGGGPSTASSIGASSSSATTASGGGWGGGGGQTQVTGSGGGGAGGASSTSGATSSTTSTSTTACAPCAKHEICNESTATCVCSPGFVSDGSACVATLPGDPTAHTQVEVCAQWNDGHMVTEPSPLVASGEQCDAGYLKSGGISDTLKRINMFRWLAGLGPTTASDAENAATQKCANLEAWWPWTGGSPHSPPSTTPCYTAEGGAAAGRSNIAWGSGGPAGAIDQFMQDNGNETTMGHRRWIVNPPLGPVGIGYWETGGMYGSASCLSVFGGSGGGPTPDWVGVPNPGFVPIEIAKWTWTFHKSGIAGATVTMIREDDGAPLEVTMLPLNQGYGQDAISWAPKGWTVEAGKTYQVAVHNGDVTVVYSVKPVTC